eukprot:1144162-Pelagomonas_calceolata.AAC.3
MKPQLAQTQACLRCTSAFDSATGSTKLLTSSGRSRQEYCKKLYLQGTAFTRTSQDIFVLSTVLMPATLLPCLQYPYGWWCRKASRGCSWLMPEDGVEDVGVPAAEKQTNAPVSTSAMGHKFVNEERWRLWKDGAQGLSLIDPSLATASCPSWGSPQSTPASALEGTI